MATDYVLRTLFDRLARSFDQLLVQVNTVAASGVPEYETVADMLAASPEDIQSFARCKNYLAGDAIKSLWMRASEVVSDNGTDNRQSTAHPAFFYERIWVREAI